MLNKEQFNGKWEEIKGGVKNLWGELTDAELEQSKENLHSVSEIVQARYGESHESVRKKLDSLMASFDNETDKSLHINDGESSFQRSPTEIRTASTSQLQDAAEDIRTRSPERTEFEESEGGAINTKEGIAGNDPTLH